MNARTPFDEIADALHTLPPGDFTAARNTAADRVKKDDPALAKRVRALHRPTLAAWAANLLAHRRPGLVRDLLDLGGALREAQAHLHGEQLRELADRRRRLVHALVARAGEEARSAGQVLGADALDGLERTLTAALADPEAGRLLAEGHLSAVLEPVLWPGAADRVPAPDPTPAPAAGAARKAVRKGPGKAPREAPGTAEPPAGDAAAKAGRAAEEERRRTLAEARAAAEEAERAAVEAGRRAQEADDGLAAAGSARERAEDEAARARTALEEARERDAAARAGLAGAERQRKAADRAARTARGRTERAREAAARAAQRLAELDPG
ncbi:hypothetical protein ACWGB8_27885 [Kitasatospora sp. NPDC054939]